jgi:hypothetical protein
MNKLSTKACIKTMGAVFISALLAIGLFNYVMNPYDIFDLPEKRRPMDLVDRSHITKAVKLIHNRADTLLIGSSIVDAGFRLQGSMTVYYDDSFKQKSESLRSLLPANTEVYDAGLRGGGLGDIYHYIQQAINNNPNLKHIIIGVEWNLFSCMRKAGDLLPATEPLGKTYVPFHFYANNLFSYGATYDSGRTFSGHFINWLHHKHMHAKNNGHDITRVFSYLNMQFQNWRYHLEDQFTAQTIPYNVIPNPVLQGQSMHDMPTLMFSIWSVSAIKDVFVRGGEKALLNDESWDYMRRIIALAKEKNIKVDVYVSPQHANYWQTMKSYGMESYNYLWLKKLAEITPFWDFSERIDFSSNVDNYFDTDALHFNPDAGEIILPTILNGGGQGVRYVTASNVDQAIAARRLNQVKWLNGNSYLREIYNHPTFLETQNFRGNYEKIGMIRYMPAVKGYQIIRFMDKFMALPQSDKPYDFRLLMLDKYPGTIHGSSLEELEKRLSA